MFKSFHHSSKAWTDSTGQNLSRILTQDATPKLPECPDYHLLNESGEVGLPQGRTSGPYIPDHKAVCGRSHYRKCSHGLVYVDGSMEDDMCFRKRTVKKIGGKPTSDARRAQTSADQAVTEADPLSRTAVTCCLEDSTAESYESKCMCTREF